MRTTVMMWVSVTTIATRRPDNAPLDIGGGVPFDVEIEVPEGASQGRCNLEARKRMSQVLTEAFKIREEKPR